MIRNALLKDSNNMFGLGYALSDTSAFGIKSYVFNTVIWLECSCGTQEMTEWPKLWRWRHYVHKWLKDFKVDLMKWKSLLNKLECIYLKKNDLKP